MQNLLFILKRPISVVRFVERPVSHLLEIPPRFSPYPLFWERGNNSGVYVMPPGFLRDVFRREGNLTTLRTLY